jgi:hypothetical protein
VTRSPLRLLAQERYSEEELNRMLTEVQQYMDFE